MSEFNPEDDVYLNLTFESGSEFQMTRYNSRLYTFFGTVALHGAELDAEEFNHIFLKTGEGQREDGITLVYGHHIFQQSPVFDQLSSFMLDYDFPASLNETTVPAEDIAAWDRCQTQDISDFIPDDWMEL